MDFSKLQDSVFLEILQYLPLKDQVRIGRVNKSFRRMSLTAISEIKSLIPWDKLTSNVYCFSSLLSYCSENLESLDFCYGPIGDGGLPLVRALADYSCPKLTSLNIFNIPIGNDVLAILLKKYPNLEIFYVRSTGQLKFPLNITCQKLENLMIMKCNSISFRSMTSRVPNLKSLDAWLSTVSMKQLDNFFASCPQLKDLTLHMSQNRIYFNRMTHFWELKWLERLDLMEQPEYLCLDDPGFKKVLASFPKLAILNVDSVLIGPVGLKALSTLENLTVLHFGEHTQNYYELDDEVPILAKFTQLEWAKFEDTIIKPTTIIALFQSLPKLRRLRVYEISDIKMEEEEEWDEEEEEEIFVETSKSAVALLESLGKVGKQRIVIEFSTRNGEFYMPWDTDGVKETLKRLAENDGVMIYLTWDRWGDIYHRMPGQW